MVEFDLQTVLSEMRSEQRQDHQDLATKLDEGFTEFRAALGKHDAHLSQHDTQLVVLEGNRKFLLWIGGTIVTALIPIVYDVIANHLHLLGVK